MNGGSDVEKGKNVALKTWGVLKQYFGSNYSQFQKNLDSFFSLNLFGTNLLSRGFGWSIFSPVLTAYKVSRQMFITLGQCCMGSRGYVAWLIMVMLRYLGKQSQLPVLDWAGSLTKETKVLKTIYSFLYLKSAW